jgi:hypothetical protein
MMLTAPLSLPETHLAAAVIQRAWDDAIVPDERLAGRRWIATRDGAQQVYGAGLKPADREEAIRFLVDDAPAWAQSRAAWCELAGIAPEALQRRARQRIPAASLPADLRRDAPLAEAA